MSGEQWGSMPERMLVAGVRFRRTVAAMSQAARDANAAPAHEPPKTAGEYATDPTYSAVVFDPPPDVLTLANRLADIAIEYRRRAADVDDDDEVVFRLTSAEMYRLKAAVIDEAEHQARGGVQR